MSGTINIVLVEDEPLLTMVTSEALEDEGFVLVKKTDGVTAIAELEANAASFQAVLTDVRLGTGPTGWDVARRARELVPTMPVIYMSADSAADWEAYGVPASIMISKPYIVAQVVTAIVMLLNKDAV